MSSSISKITRLYIRLGTLNYGWVDPPHHLSVTWKVPDLKELQNFWNVTPEGNKTDYAR